MLFEAPSCTPRAERRTQNLGEAHPRRAWPPRRRGSELTCRKPERVQAGRGPRALRWPPHPRPGPRPAARRRGEASPGRSWRRPSSTACGHNPAPHRRAEGGGAGAGPSHCGRGSELGGHLSFIAHVLPRRVSFTSKMYLRPHSLPLSPPSLLYSKSQHIQPGPTEKQPVPKLVTSKP